MYRSLCFCSIKILLLVIVFLLLLLAVLKTRVPHIETERLTPLIFIGGYPRSGTTLMRAILDTHPDVRCGQETRIVPYLIAKIYKFALPELQTVRLKEAGISRRLLNNAVAKFTLEIIKNHGPPARRYCDKDPFLMSAAPYILEVFPNSKFVFMVRDGRASTNSIVIRNVTIDSLNISSWYEVLSSWNERVHEMFNHCDKIGKKKCLMVFYEQLVANPAEEIAKILKFLDLSWTDNVLHHSDYFNQTNGILVSPLEKSTSQIMKPIYLDSLDDWRLNIPSDIAERAGDIAPMLKVLGYINYEIEPRTPTTIEEH